MNSSQRERERESDRGEHRERNKYEIIRKKRKKYYKTVKVQQTELNG